MSRYSLIFESDTASIVGAHPLPPGVGLESIPPALRRSRYNIGRDQDIIVLCQPEGEGAPVARTMRWGFTPRWIHDPNPALQPLTVPDRKLSQPYFRDAFHQRRCLIPATGFYAWQGWENGPADPCYVYMRDRQPFFMAGIWDNCEGVDRVAMITTAANALVRPIHDRMPAIIAREQVGAWLRGDHIEQLIAPYSAAAMVIHPVSRKVFSLGNDSPELIASLPAAAIRARA